MGDRLEGWHKDKDGTGWHYRDGKLHREDGPAIIRPSGYKGWWLTGTWWLNGKEVRMEDVLDTPEKREAYLLEESIRRL